MTSDVQQIDQRDHGVGSSSSVDTVIARRLKAGKCLRCDDPALEDSNYCETHRRYLADLKIAMRERRRKAGKCAECGLTSKTFRCRACAISQGGSKRGIKPDVDLATATRIGADGRSRYHGRMRRGRQSKRWEDTTDLRYAIKALAAAEVRLADARADDVPKAVKREHEQEAIAQVSLASKFLDEVLERNRRA